MTKTPGRRKRRFVRRIIRHFGFSLRDKAAPPARTQWEQKKQSVGGIRVSIRRLEGGR